MTFIFVRDFFVGDFQIGLGGLVTCCIDCIVACFRILCKMQHFLLFVSTMLVLMNLMVKFRAFDWI